jgi:hypothetical protein
VYSDKTSEKYLSGTEAKGYYHRAWLGKKEFNCMQGIQQGRRSVLVNEMVGLCEVKHMLGEFSAHHGRITPPVAHGNPLG